MTEKLDIPRLLELRKLTRAVSIEIEQELRAHLATLIPLLSAKSVFGDYIRGGVKTPVRGADKAFEELKKGFQSLAASSPFNIPPDLEPPLDLLTSKLVLIPVEYEYAVGDPVNTRITITSPLRWWLSYPDIPPSNIKTLLSGRRNLVENDLRHALLHYLGLEITLAARPGLSRLLDALRFPLRVEQLEGLGGLPVAQLSCPVTTLRPPDDIIIQNTEISGVPSFEEVISLNDIKQMVDPFGARIRALVERTSAGLYQEIAG